MSNDGALGTKLKTSDVGTTAQDHAAPTSLAASFRDRRIREKGVAARDIRRSLLHSIDNAINTLLAERSRSGYWRGQMPAGPAQSALCVAASAVWRNLDDDELGLLNSLKKALQNANSRGEAELIASCFAIAHRSGPTGSSRKVRHTGWFYSFLAKSLDRAFGPKSGTIGFSWYPTIFDLAVHHWAFAPLRRVLARAALDQVPAIGLLLEAGACRTALVRFWRDSFGKLGRNRRERRLGSIVQALREKQEPNGCWSWTTMGTACSLLALRTVAETHGPEVDSGLRYLDDLRCQTPDGQRAISWA